MAQALPLPAGKITLSVIMKTTENVTMKKFGAPATEIRVLDHWLVLLRPQQVTLGSLVLIATDNATAFSALSPAAFTELHQATVEIEQALAAAFGYDKINYLMLMMVDPDVHFHILPRYRRTHAFQGHDFCDHGWPGPPRLDSPNPTDSTLNQQILKHLQSHWPS